MLRRQQQQAQQLEAVFCGAATADMLVYKKKLLQLMPVYMIRDYRAINLETTCEAP
jgi:hypothetical protein